MKVLFATIILFSSISALAQDVRVIEVKKEIMSLARQFEGKTDTDGKLQEALEQKVADLEKLLPDQTTTERAQKIMGEWRQVFGPYSATGDGTIPFGSRTDQIYQIIFPNGIFYNVALFEKARIKMVFLLKGEYKIMSEAIKGTFVKNSIVLRNISEKTLSKLPAQLESGSLKVINLPNRLPPVGMGGQLFEVYADEDVRILRGRTPQFKRPALYVMEKVKH